MRIDCRRMPIGRIAISWTLVFGITAAATACQSIDSESETRANPAPWRPAFGSINQSAVDANPDASKTPVSIPTDRSNLLGINSGDPLASRGPVANTTDGNTAGGNSVGNRNTNFDNPNSPPEARYAHLDRDDDAGPGITQVTQRLDKLPNSAGQVWREYDISPYTSKITNNEHPQQTIIDWITRETGHEMWFNQPLGILSATPNQLYVYHTPEIQNVVRRVVDRFVRTRGQLQKLDVTLMTVGNPNWRATAYTMLQPIEVRAAGVQAFMVSKENAALLQGQLARRSDARTINTGTLINHDGQKLVLEKTRPTQFVSSLQWMPNQNPNYQPLMTNIKEGYTLGISCLTSLDNSTIEAVIKCDVDQVEDLSNVKVNLPGIGGNTQQMNLQIPQLISWRLHERFRWPSDQVLLLSCGVVATPEPDSGGGIGKIPLLGLNSKSKRADALLFLEYRGPATEASVPRTADAGLAPLRPR